MGELMPGQVTNQDESFMPFLSSANISCGAHSGTSQIIENTMKLASEHKLRIGAHPSYPDKENFGRKSITIDPIALKVSLLNQIHFLQEIGYKYNIQINYIKPHGALYNDIANDENLARIVLSCVHDIDPKLKIMGLSGSPLEKWVSSAGLEFISEVFADRRYTPLLKLKSRKESGALITSEEEMREQLALFLNNQVKDEKGQVHSIKCDSICFHSDTPNALTMIKSAFNFLKENNIVIAPDK